MKQKTIKFILTSIVILCTQSLLLVLPVSVYAAAGCVYTVDFKETKNITSAVPGQLLNFQATVTEKGDASCSSNIKITTAVQDTDSTGKTNNIGGDSNTVSFANGIATTTFQYTADNTTTESVKVFVLVPGTFSDTQVTVSSPWVVNITGGGLTSGGNFSISLNPQKGSFNNGDTVNIIIGIPTAGLYSNLQSRGVQYLYIVPIINGQSGYQGFTFSLDSVHSGATYPIDVTADQGFKSGPNTIEMDAYQADNANQSDITMNSGTSLKLGSVTTSLNVQGIGISGNPTVTISPNSSTIPTGTNIIVTATGLPTGSKLVVYVNNVQTSSDSPNGNGQVTITVSTSNPNIQAAGSNAISFAVLDSNGNRIPANGNPLTFTIGSASTKGNSSGSGVGSVTNSTTNCSTAPAGTPNCVYNPLGVSDLTAFLLQLIKYLLALVGSVAVLAIIIGGFRMVLAQGNEESLGVAKKTVTWAIIGLLVAVLSFSIVAIVSNLLQVNAPAVTTTTSSGQ